MSLRAPLPQTRLDAPFSLKAVFMCTHGVQPPQDVAVEAPAKIFRMRPWSAGFPVELWSSVGEVGGAGLSVCVLSGAEAGYGGYCYSVGACVGVSGCCHHQQGGHRAGSVGVDAVCDLEQ